MSSIANTFQNSPMSFTCLRCGNGRSPNINGQCYHCYRLVRSAKFYPPPHLNFRQNSSFESNRRKGHVRFANLTRALSKKFSRPERQATGEPRLVRSGGMRPDWRFEVLMDARRNARENKLRDLARLAGGLGLEIPTQVLFSPASTLLSGAPQASTALLKKFNRRATEPQATGEARLVRSCGMPRVCNFEDLWNTRRNARKNNHLGLARLAGQHNLEIPTHVLFSPAAMPLIGAPQASRALSNKFNRQATEPQATGEPHLVGSGDYSVMPRVWSFEDLRKAKRNAFKNKLMGQLGLKFPSRL